MIEQVIEEEGLAEHPLFKFKVPDVNAPGFLKRQRTTLALQSAQLNVMKQLRLLQKDIAAAEHNGTELGYEPEETILGLYAELDRILKETADFLVAFVTVPESPAEARAALDELSQQQYTDMLNAITGVKATVPPVKSPDSSNG